MIKNRKWKGKGKGWDYSKKFDKKKKFRLWGTRKKIHSFASLKSAEKYGKKYGHYGIAKNLESDKKKRAQWVILR